jgi:NADH-quinone oxidoreductase subunit E
VNELREKYAQEIDQILKKYPPDQKQSAVMFLLFLAQKEEGYLKDQALDEIGQILEMEKTEVSSLVGFYTLYHDQKGGKYRIQVCTDLCCALRGADEFLEKLIQELGIQPGETTPDGLVSLETVKCLAACDKAPMFQVQTGDTITYHENQDLSTALDLIDRWRKQESAQDGEVS